MFLLVFNPQQLYSFLVRVIGFHVNFSTLVPMISGKKKKKKKPCIFFRNLPLYNL